MSLPIFGGNHKAENYRDMVADLVKSYKAMGCNVSGQLLFLDSHLDFFSEYPWAVSEKHGEQFHFHHGIVVPRQVESQYAD